MCNSTALRKSTKLLKSMLLVSASMMALSTSVELSITEANAQTADSCSIDATTLDVICSDIPGEIVDDDNGFFADGDILSLTINQNAVIEDSGNGGNGAFGGSGIAVIEIVNGSINRELNGNFSFSPSNAGTIRDTGAPNDALFIEEGFEGFGNTLFNTQTGLIEGQLDGIRILNQSDSEFAVGIQNSGGIIGDSDGNGTGDGIEVDSLAISGSIANTSGIITGGESGIEITGNNTLQITNSSLNAPGRIAGDTDGDGIGAGIEFSGTGPLTAPSGSINLVTNFEDSLIEGASGIIFRQDPTSPQVDLVQNNGVIQANDINGVAIDFGPGDDILEINANGQFIGDVRGGDGNDTIRFADMDSFGSDDIDIEFDVSLIDVDGTTAQFQSFETIEKVETNTLTLVGTLTDTLPGGVQVNQGTLQLDGVVSSSGFFISELGTLTGNGTAGDLIVNTSGVFAPGPGISQFDVTNNLNLQTGSIFLADIASNGDSDVIGVGGETTLNGIIVANPIDDLGLFAAGQTFSIVNSDSVSGAFEEIFDPFPDLDLVQSIVGTDVQLSLVAGAPNDSCVTMGSTTICQRDQREGIVSSNLASLGGASTFDADTTSQLEVNNLTDDIVTAPGFAGIGFNNFANDDDITITSDTGPFEISTFGTDSPGIQAIGVGGDGDVTITSSGDIVTRGSSAPGIEVFQGDNPTDSSIGVDGITTTFNPGAGDVTVISNSNITTFGGSQESFIPDPSTSDAIRINILEFGTSVSNIDVTSNGELITFGEEASGIRVDGSSINGTSSARIRVNNNITTNGEGTAGFLTANGVDADVSGAGGLLDFTLAETATITVNGVGNGLSFSSDGLAEQGGGLIAQIDGDIINNGDGAGATFFGGGINVSNADATIIVNGNITTTDGTGIDTSSFRNLDVEVNGDITTGGDGLEFTGSDLNSEINVNATINGDITTTGDEAEGVAIIANSSFASDTTETSIVNLELVGTVSTSGESADGIFLSNSIDQSVNTITTTGDITTQGDEANGIIATNTGTGDINITANGNITTTGENANGITASVSGPATAAGIGGDINITTMGVISTTGPNSSGISADSLNAGDITINAGGTVSGIVATADGSDLIVINANDVIGEVTATQDNSGAGNDGGNLFIDVTGTITGELNVLKENGGSQNITVNNITSDDVAATIVQDGGNGIGATFTSTGTISAVANAIQIATDNSNPQTITVNDVVGDSDGDGIGVGILSVINNSAFLSLDTTGDVSGGNAGISIIAATLTSTDPTPISIDTSGTVTGDVGIQASRTAAAGATLTNSGTITGRNGIAIDLQDQADDTLILTSTAIINGDSNLGDGQDTFIFEDGFTTSGIIDGGADFDDIEIDVAASETRVLDFAPLPLDNFEQITKRGAGTLNVLGGEIADPIVLQAVEGLVQVLSDQPNLSVETLVNSTLISQTQLASVFNSGNLAVGTGVTGDIATLSLTDSLILEPGGILNVDIDAPTTRALSPDPNVLLPGIGDADLIEVDGPTQLGGTLNVNALGVLDDFIDDDQFIIIDSAGDVSGSFADVTDNLPDLDVNVDIVDGGDGGEEVQLTLDAGDDLSDTSVVANTLQAQIETGGLFTGALLNRTSGGADGRGIQVVRLNDAGSSSTVAAFTERPSLPSVFSQYGADLDISQKTLQSIKPIYSAWFAGLGAFNDTDASGAASAYEASTGGFATGLDALFKRSNLSILVGGAFGYTRTNVNSGLSSSDVDTFHFGAYGSLEKNAARFEAAFSYGFQDTTIDRVIPIGAAAVVASGDADGDLFGFAIEGSYDVAEKLNIGRDINLRFAPIVGFQFGSADRDGFTETGAGVLNQTFFDDTFERSFVSGGFSLEAKFAQENGTVIRPHLDLRYERGLGDLNTVSASIIAPVAGAAFTGAGTLESRNRFALQSGVTVDFNQRISANLNYQGTFSGASQNNRIQGGFSVRF